ncbi:hypothetical protein RJ640_017065 [Escallonia rubra]|uniref:Uncharacterized protein n=1 Tax=Escallonia rubra TaxID=112253 RepID=A0AA88UT09_9ASTE|nr:hypothetical protein RJ640_017065 [Escallonia rubra]
MIVKEEELEDIQDFLSLLVLFSFSSFHVLAPPFLHGCRGELKRLKNLVIDAKKRDIKVVSALVKRMLERNIFLFGFVDINKASIRERVNELTEIQNTRVQVAHKKLFADSRIEHFIHMDLGMELDVDMLKKISTDYAVAKELAIKGIFVYFFLIFFCYLMIKDQHFGIFLFSKLFELESSWKMVLSILAGEAVNVQNIKHIAEDKSLIGDVVEKTSEDWNAQKEMFYQQTGFRQRPAQEPQQQEKNGTLEQLKGNETSEEQEDDDEFGKELEEALQFEDDNE